MKSILNTMSNLNRNNFQAHPFHLVSRSPWPLYTSLSLLTLTTSAILYKHLQLLHFVYSIIVITFNLYSYLNLGLVVDYLDLFIKGNGPSGNPSDFNGGNNQNTPNPEGPNGLSCLTRNLMKMKILS